MIVIDKDKKECRFGPPRRELTAVKAASLRTC
jgi:hypothetical protein